MKPGLLEDLRKHSRVRLFTEVEVRADDETTRGRMQNISVGGLRLLTRHTFYPDSEVFVRFELPDGRPIAVRGRVVHAESGLQMGIEFLDLKHEDQQAIAAFVQEFSS